MPFAPPAGAARLTEKQATNILLRFPKVANWLERYPPKPQTEAEYRPATDEWVVKAWSGEAGQIVLGKVDDRSGVGARGVDGAAGRLDDGTRRRRRLRRQDDQRHRGSGSASAPSSSSASPTCAARSRCATSTCSSCSPSRSRSASSTRARSSGARRSPIRRCSTCLPAASGSRAATGRLAPAYRSGRSGCWPRAAVFLGGFRVGLNLEAKRSVIDVGFAGVVGAQRIANGEMPYGHMPDPGDQKPCGPADAEGEIRERIQTNGHCEASNPRGDTYGPVSYLAYLPGYAVFGWSGKWDELWAAHATSLLFDGLCLLGLALVGRRFGGARLAATLAFAWAAYPFTLYASNSNTNDTIMPAFLIWGFWLASSAWARGAAVALAGWTKFAALLLAPLWLSYPDGWRAPRRAASRSRSRGATVAAFLVLLLEPDPLHAARVFGERTFGFQLDRDSPFSLWGWGQYHAAGVPDLHVVQQVLEVLARRRRAAGRVRAAPEVDPAARRAHRRRPDRLRGRADALVLPLHPLVLPLCRLRSAGRARARVPPVH